MPSSVESPLRQVPSVVRRLESYSGFHRRQVRVYEPRDVSELSALVRALGHRGVRFSVMGAGHSFGSHFLSERAVLSTARLRNITLRLDEGLVTVQAGAQWGEILARILARGYVVPVVPTISSATAGGTASADTYNRFSSGFGKEADSIVSLMVVLPNGEVRRCSRDVEPELFFGTVGGFGLLGVVVEITYRVHHVGNNPALYSEGTIVDGVADQRFLRSDLRDARFGGRGFSGSASAFYWRGTSLRNLTWKFAWVDDASRQPCALHAHHPLRVLGDLAVRQWPQLAVEAWNLYYRRSRRTYPSNVVFVDDPWGATFFMDSNVKSRSVARSLGLSTSVLQQSFAVPCTGDAVADAGRFRTFIRYALEDMRRRGLQPAMVDGQFLPQGTPSALTSNPGHDAYLLSFAFEGRAASSYHDVAQFFSSLSFHLHAHYDGRVHLTKNLCCPPELLGAMYASQLARMRRRKLHYDPQGLLANDQLAELLRWAGSEPACSNGAEAHLLPRGASSRGARHV